MAQALANTPEQTFLSRVEDIVHAMGKNLKERQARRSQGVPLHEDTLYIETGKKLNAELDALTEQDRPTVVKTFNRIIKQYL